MRIPLAKKITELTDLPYTISFVIRKRLQIDGFSDMPKEKRPSEKMIWEGTVEDIERWIEEVYGNKVKQEFDFVISDSEIER